MTRNEPPIRIPKSVMIRFAVSSAFFACAFAIIVAAARNDSNLSRSMSGGLVFQSRAARARAATG